MRREDRDGILAFGHYGRPLLVFPSQQADRYEWEHHGMVAALAPLLDAGRIKLYCVDSWDTGSWFDHGLPLDERAYRHGAFDDWLLHHVVPWIHADCLGPQPIGLAGTSFGAFHAANLALRRSDLFPLAVCLSGVYDVSRVGWGEPGDATYFHNPEAYVANLHGEHLDWLRANVHLVLVAGGGRWEDSTGARASTERFASILAGKGIRHDLDLWGADAAHDWPTWRDQIRHHLERLA
jgi:esterase/lipase superfamily enzyme